MLNIEINQSIKDFLYSQVEPKFSRNKSGEKAYNIYTQDFNFLDKDFERFKYVFQKEKK